MKLFLNAASSYEPQIADRFNEELGKSKYRFSANSHDSKVTLQGPNDLIVFTVIRERGMTPFRAKKISLEGDSSSILVVSRFISPRASQILWEKGISYVDTYGNYGIVNEEPFVRLRKTVLTKDPNPPERAIASLRGPRNAAIILALYHGPNYKVRTIAEKSHSNIGNVSRLLRFLVDQGIAEKNTSGEVVSIDQETLLKSWSEVWNPFASDECYSYVAPYGVDRLLKAIEEKGSRDALFNKGHRFALSGVQSVHEYVATYPSDMIKVYAEHVQAFADEFDLVQSNVGARIQVVQPKGDYPFTIGSRIAKYHEMQLPSVAIELACADLLNGSGREPSVAEDVIARLRKIKQW